MNDIAVNINLEKLAGLAVWNWYSGIRKKNTK
jgi:hypothetical protein